MGSNKADNLKCQGNQFFVKGEYQEAIRCYSEAIKYDPSNPILYSNRAFAYIKLNDFKKAESDCDKSIELNNVFDKAYFRRGLTRKHLKKFKSALHDFQKALSISPNNREIKKEVESLEKILKSDKPIRIYPFHMAEECRSKLPLKDIAIFNENNVVMKEESNSSDPRLHAYCQKLVQEHIPEDFYGFNKLWRELKEDELKLQLLENIKLSSYEKIFEYPFEPELMFNVIYILSLSKNHSLVYQILATMTKMPRFDFNIQFISNQEKQLLKKIFINLSNNKNLQSLVEKFNFN